MKAHKGEHESRFCSYGKKCSQMIGFESNITFSERMWKMAIQSTRRKNATEIQSSTFALFLDNCYLPGCHRGEGICHIINESKCQPDTSHHRRNPKFNVQLNWQSLDFISGRTMDYVRVEKPLQKGKIT